MLEATLNCFILSDSLSVLRLESSLESDLNFNYITGELTLANKIQDLSRIEAAAFFSLLSSPRLWKPLQSTLSAFFLRPHMLGKA